MFNYFHCLIMLIVTINYLLTYTATFIFIVRVRLDKGFIFVATALITWTRPIVVGLGYNPAF